LHTKSEKIVCKSQRKFAVLLDGDCKDNVWEHQRMRDLMATMSLAPMEG